MPLRPTLVLLLATTAAQAQPAAPAPRDTTAVPAARDNAADLKACQARQLELAPKAQAYTGEARIKRLIEADLRRAAREELEGDGDECLEALDHAAKLLTGAF